MSFDVRRILGLDGRKDFFRFFSFTLVVKPLSVLKSALDRFGLRFWRASDASLKREPRGREKHYLRAFEGEIHGGVTIAPRRDPDNARSFVGEGSGLFKLDGFQQGKQKANKSKDNRSNEKQQEGIGFGQLLGD